MKQHIKEALEDVKLEKLAAVIKNNYLGQCFKRPIGALVDKIIDVRIFHYGPTKVIGVVFDAADGCSKVNKVSTLSFIGKLNGVTKLPVTEVSEFKLPIHEKCELLYDQLIKRFRGTKFYSSVSGNWIIEDFEFFPEFDDIHVYIRRTIDVENKITLSREKFWNTLSELTSIPKSNIHTTIMTNT